MSYRLRADMVSESRNQRRSLWVDDVFPTDDLDYGPETNFMLKHIFHIVDVS